MCIFPVYMHMQQSMRILVCAIPEKMKWIFFHEFGHALDIYYLAREGEYLSDTEGFQALIEAEGEAFDRHVPFEGEHPDAAECLAEMVASYYCARDTLQSYCPQMYDFLSTIEDIPVSDWTTPLPGSDGIIIYS